MRGLATAGDVEYRCWPSFSPRGCVLAVHSAQEGMALCSTHPQCTSFSLSGETTWSGEFCGSALLLFCPSGSVRFELVF